MFDITMQLNRDAQVFYVVSNSTDNFEGKDIWRTASAAAWTALSGSAAACGALDIPMGDVNFTLTVGSRASSQECDEYVHLVSSGTADDWASMQRCIRCPVLTYSTQYQVSSCLAPDSCGDGAMPPTFIKSLCCVRAACRPRQHVQGSFPVPA